MAVVLDTDDLLPADRAEAVRAAMRDARVPADLRHDPDAALVRARIEVWELGGGVSLVHRAGTGVTLARTPRQVRSHAEERVSLTLLGPGRWRFAQGAVEQVVDDGRWSACLVDQSAPYGFERVGPSQMYAIGVDPEVLGLPLDAVRKAAHRVGDSPLLDMVVRHVTDLARLADAVPPGPATTMLGSATAELVRAVLTAAAGTQAPMASGLPELLTTTRMFVDRHLTEADLTPGRIARAHHVSLRLLYAAWSRNEVSLAGYVLRQRLELARRALVLGNAGPTPTIAAVGRRCGFVDAAHFLPSLPGGLRHVPTRMAPEQLGYWFWLVSQSRHRSAVTCQRAPYTSAAS